MKKFGFSLVLTLVCAVLLCVSAWGITAAAAPAAPAAAEGTFGDATQTVYDGDKKIGERISSQASYSLPVPLDGFYSNFVVQNKQGATVVTLSQGGTAVVTFRFDYGQAAVGGSVTFAAGDAVPLEEIAYLGGNEVQYRIGREKRVSLEDGSISYIWTLRVNSFSRRFAVGDAREKLLSEKAAEPVTYAVQTDMPVVTQAVAEHCLYDYPVIQNAVATVPSTLSYERFSFSWQSPEGYNQNGFVIERYTGGVLENTTTFASATIATLSETRMKQGTTYTYRIYAYDDTNVGYAPCPKVMFRFADYDITTRKGSLPAAIGILVAVAVGIAAVILLYTFRYKFPARRHANESADKKKKP